ncbi:MAG TPA: response regulator transcription factor [Verrucomicrobiae bacterium]|nr:response regulator transcription factor [Verrucomicrobiae bacterium]
MRSKATSVQRKTILVVEDDEAAGELVCESLKEAGFKTHWVRDGIDALNYILESRPDGIVLDLLLPRLNGFEICGMVRKSRSVQWTPIIMMSGRIEHHDKMQAFELGADDYVSKPFRIDELVARVEAVLHRNAGNYESTPFASSYNN